MKKVLLTAAAVATLGAMPAVSYADIAFNVGAVTEYRYRGIAQSRFRPALQGGADFSAGGFYLGTWASTIKWIKDAGGDSDIELDVYGGYKGEIAKDLTYDVGVLQYIYPSHKLATSPNTFEIYGAITRGPFTAKYSHSTTNLFGFADSKNSGYIDLSATFEITDGWTVTPHVGYQKVRGSGNDPYSYSDLALTVTKDFSGLVASAALVYADVDKINGTYAYFSPKGKNLGRGGLVLSVKYNF